MPTSRDGALRAVNSSFERNKSLWGPGQLARTSFCSRPLLRAYRSSRCDPAGSAVFMRFLSKYMFLSAWEKSSRIVGGSS